MLFYYVIFSAFAALVAGFGPNVPLPAVLKNPLETLTSSISSVLPNISNFLTNIQPDSLPGILNFIKSLHFQPETFLNTEDLVRYYGFPIENHKVITKDGYILTLHRIPGNKTHQFNRNLNPMLLVHGTFVDDECFLTNTPENSFPLLLANAGFDVWLANHRGSTYSRAHVTLKPYQPEFWEFSWDEIATLDMPANIDYILNLTGHEQVFYSGHSMGGALPFALCADKPEYMKKIKAIFNLAAMSNLANTSAIAKLLAKSEPVLQEFVQLTKIQEIPAVPQLVGGLLGKFADPLVQQLIFSIFGPDYQEWNSSRTEVHLAHYFSTSSMHILLQELQTINNNGFRKYDWGEEINERKYGKKFPPDYDLTKIYVPTYLFYGENDELCPKNNDQFLKDNLQNATMIKAGGFWNHLDFLWAKNAKAFYNFLVPLILNFS